MTDYHEGTIADHPDLHEPPETARLRCRCGFDGQAPVGQTSVRCPGCHVEYQLDGDVVKCDHCGLLMPEPADVGRFFGDDVCADCFTEAYTAWANGDGNRVAAEVAP